MTLNTEPITAPGAAPERWLYVLHGIFGMGRNWGTVARKLVAERPEWGAVLVDLREHGASQGFAPPHTIEAAAADLLETTRAERPAAAVAGHSFGGKVALAYTAEAPEPLVQTWVIDSTPAARAAPSGSAYEMLMAVRALPSRFESREALVQALEAEGVDRPVAQWMATNLERRDDALVWRFDLDAMQALLEDFFRRDLWPVLETPPNDVAIEVVRATRSSVLDADAVARIRALAHGRVTLHELEGGHWLNADNPGGVISLLAAGLPR